MKCLFLDLASHDAKVCTVTEDSALCTRIQDTKDEAGLFSVIDEHLKDLTHLAAITGPGGFMSLRTEIALINTLQWNLDVPLAGIHLSDLWEARLPPLLRPSPVNGGGVGEGVLWIHSTKRDAFFVRGFGSYEKRWKEPTLISLEDLQKDIDHETSYVGEVLEEQRKALPQLTELTDVKPIEEVLPELLASALFEKKPLAPWYGRGA